MRQSSLTPENYEKLSLFIEAHSKETDRIFQVQGQR